MAQYHFNVFDGVSRPACEGFEMADRAAAWSEAVRSYGEMIREFHAQMPTGDEIRMEVTDGGGQPVFTLRFMGEEHGGRPSLRIVDGEQPSLAVTA